MRKRILSIFMSLIMCFTLISNLTGCAQKFRANAKELTSQYERNITDDGEVTEEFKKAFCNFSFKLTKAHLENNSEKDKNELISPLSAIIALAMLANGADGESLAELEALFEMDIEELNRCLYAYTKSLYRSDKCKVNIADSIWKRDDAGFTLKPDFLQTIANWYDAEVFEAAFDDTTVGDINNWCSNKTEGLIKNAVTRETVENANIMLINALLFDAKWSSTYEKDKVFENKNFLNFDGKGTNITMLSSTESYYAGENYCGMRKNYIDGKYSFFAILPDEGLDAYDFLAEIDGEKWLEILASDKGEIATVLLPEFKYEANMDMKPVLETLGAGSLFGVNANLNRLADPTGDGRHVESAYQKSFIEVDRNGTKAAAVTIIATNDGFCAIEIPKKVILNRPFIYAIMDNATGLPLFLGVMAWNK